MGSYSFFNQGVDVFADNAFVVPQRLPAGSLRDLLTIFLDPSSGKGGILTWSTAPVGPPRSPTPPRR